MEANRRAYGKGRNRERARRYRSRNCENRERLSSEGIVNHKPVEDRQENVVPYTSIWTYGENSTKHAY